MRSVSPIPHTIGRSDLTSRDRLLAWESTPIRLATTPLPMTTPLSTTTASQDVSAYAAFFDTPNASPLRIRPNQEAILVPSMDMAQWQEGERSPEYGARAVSPAELVSSSFALSPSQRVNVHELSRALDSPRSLRPRSSSPVQWGLRHEGDREKSIEKALELEKERVLFALRGLSANRLRGLRESVGDNILTQQSDSLSKPTTSPVAVEEPVPTSQGSVVSQAKSARSMRYYEKDAIAQRSRSPRSIRTADSLAVSSNSSNVSGTSQSRTGSANRRRPAEVADTAARIRNPSPTSIRKPKALLLTANSVSFDPFDSLGTEIDAAVVNPQSVVPAQTSTHARAPSKMTPLMPPDPRESTSPHYNLQTPMSEMGESHCFSFAVSSVGSRTPTGSSMSYAQSRSRFTFPAPVSQTSTPTVNGNGNASANASVNGNAMPSTATVNTMRSRTPSKASLQSATSNSQQSRNVKAKSVQEKRYEQLRKAADEWTTLPSNTFASGLVKPSPTPILSANALAAASQEAVQAVTRTGSSGNLFSSGRSVAPTTTPVTVQSMSYFRTARCAVKGSIVRTCKDEEEVDMWSSNWFERCVFVIDSSTTKSTERVYRDDVRMVTLSWSAFIRCCDGLTSTDALPLSERQRLRNDMELLAEQVAVMSMESRNEVKPPVLEEEAAAADENNATPSKTVSPAPTESLWFFMRTANSISAVLPMLSTQQLDDDVGLFFDTEELTLAILGHSGGEKHQLIKHDVAWLALTQGKSPFALFEDISRYAQEQQETQASETIPEDIIDRGLMIWQSEPADAMLRQSTVSLQSTMYSLPRMKTSATLLFPNHDQLIKSLTQWLTSFRGRKLTIIFAGYSTPAHGDWLLSDESTFSATDLLLLLQTSVSPSIATNMDFSIVIHSLYSRAWFSSLSHASKSAFRPSEAVPQRDVSMVAIESLGDVLINGAPIPASAVMFDLFVPVQQGNKESSAPAVLLARVSPMEVNDSRSFVALKSIFERLSNASTQSALDSLGSDAWHRWQSLDGIPLKQTWLMALSAGNALSPMQCVPSLPPTAMNHSDMNSVTASMNMPPTVPSSRESLLLRKLRGPRLLLFSAQYGGGAAFVWKEQKLAVWIVGRSLHHADRRLSMQKNRLFHEICHQLRTIVCISHFNERDAIDLQRSLRSLAPDHLVETVCIRIDSQEGGGSLPTPRTPNAADRLNCSMQSINSCERRGRSRSRDVSSTGVPVRAFDHSTSASRSRSRSADRSRLVSTASEKLLTALSQLGRDWSLSRSLSEICAQRGISLVVDGSPCVINANCGALASVAASVSVHTLPPITKSSELRARSRSPSAAARAAGRTPTTPRGQLARSFLVDDGNGLSLSTTLSPSFKASQSLSSSSTSPSSSSNALAFIVEVLNVPEAGKSSTSSHLMLFGAHLDHDSLQERLALWRRRQRRDYQQTQFLYAELSHSHLAQSAPHQEIHINSEFVGICGEHHPHDELATQSRGLSTASRPQGSDHSSNNTSRLLSERFLMQLMGKRAVFNWLDDESSGGRESSSRVGTSATPACTTAWAFAVRERIKTWKFPPDNGHLLDIDVSPRPTLSAIDLQEL